MAAPARPPATGLLPRAGPRTRAARERRDPAGRLRQAGGRLPHPRGCPARAHRQLQPGRPLVELGALPRAREAGPDHVRPDDRRKLDLHRDAGILQGTYETFAAAARKHFGGSLAGKLVVTGGMGGMGGAQPLVAQLHAAPLQIHSMVRRLDQLAVHPHPTRFNPASRLAPRSQPRLRQNPVGCLQRPMPAILFCASP